MHHNLFSFGCFGCFCILRRKVNVISIYFSMMQKKDKQICVITHYNGIFGLCRCTSCLHYQHISILRGTVHHTSYLLLFSGEMVNKLLLIFLLCQDPSFLDWISLSPVKCIVTPEQVPVPLKCVASFVEGSFVYPSKTITALPYTCFT